MREKKEELLPSRLARVVATENRNLLSIQIFSTGVVIDGVNLQAGNVVLLVGQTIMSENGLWLVGSPSPRPLSCVTPEGTSVFVQEGKIGFSSLYVCKTWTRDSVVFDRWGPALDHIHGVSFSIPDKHLVLGRESTVNVNIGPRNTLVGLRAGEQLDVHANGNTVVGNAVLWPGAVAQVVLADGQDRSVLHSDGVTGDLRVGYSSLSSKNNVLVGNGSVMVSGLGNSNTLVGGSIATGLSDGVSLNTFVGFGAGADVRMGNANTVLGSARLWSDAFQEIQVADGNGNALLSGNANSGDFRVGYSDLGEGRTNNVVVGNHPSNRSLGVRNTLLGGGAGGSLNNANQNTLVGVAAGSRITTGSNNTVLGAAAGEPGWTRQVVLSDGTGMPSLALDGVQGQVRIGFPKSTGANNVIIGNGSGGGDPSSCSGNTCVGHMAAQNLKGNRNLILGNEAAMKLQNGNNNTLIGGASIDNTTIESLVLISDGNGRPTFMGNPTMTAMRIDTVTPIDTMPVEHAFGVDWFLSENQRDRVRFLQSYIRASDVLFRRSLWSPVFKTVFAFDSFVSSSGNFRSINGHTTNEANHMAKLERFTTTNPVFRTGNAAFPPHFHFSNTICSIPASKNDGIDYRMSTLYLVFEIMEFNHTSSPNSILYSRDITVMIFNVNTDQFRFTVQSAGVQPISFASLTNLFYRKRYVLALRMQNGKLAVWINGAACEVAYGPPINSGIDLYIGGGVDPVGGYINGNIFEFDVHFPSASHDAVAQHLCVLRSKWGAS